MNQILLFSGIGLAGLTAVGVVARKTRIRWLSRERLETFVEAVQRPDRQDMPPPRPCLVRHRLLPWLIGLAAAGVVHFVFGGTLPFVVAVGLMFALLGVQTEAHLAASKSLKVETQLADAIDLMVGALGAGASVGEALENAARESRRPLRPEFEDMIGRVRLGDDPQNVYHNLAVRVPLETFLLFSSALSMHAETGGSLTPSLASVARTIRDRIEITRRIRTNSIQSEVSTVTVLLLTYFIALVMWRSNPSQVQQFLATTSGQWAVAMAILLQALGLAWMSAVSRLRF
jgi:tight adherence protein B